MTEAPIALYFGAPAGKHVSLEVVARATIEWVETIRDIAAVVAPDVEYELVFVESEEGSLWLSNLIRAVRGGDRKALASLVGAVIVFFAMGPASHLQTDLGDAFWERLGHKHDVHIASRDKREIIEGAVKAFEETQARERVSRLIAYAEQDPGITSIGVDLEPRRAGAVVTINREQFSDYQIAEEAARPTYRRDTELLRSVRVKIVRANLKEGDAKPRWRFLEGDTEWSADIVDEEFVAALNAESTGLPLAVGQQMVVDVAVDRRFKEQAWEEANRRILFVRLPAVPRAPDLFGPRG